MYLPYAKLKNKKDLSFLEIKLSNIIHNYSTIKSFVDDEVIVASVVKADAYGIGILKVVKILHNIGCQHFFVNTIKEGISIRKHINNKNVSIYILTGYFGTNEYKKYNLIPIIICLLIVVHLHFYQIYLNGILVRLNICMICLLVVVV